ncbi:UNVERIFIED_CONTAM: DUF21 domain-containing protein, chloroplastic [Sesamum radiatum]|uniref:DUF21 domain-containing protein, chloroplastic n=1 Tax=Sesamum radiatum TaxID=300843 RepID=A0AAW2KJ43_SESRA
MAKGFAGVDGFQRAGFSSCGLVRAISFFLHGRDLHYPSFGRGRVWNLYFCMCYQKLRRCCDINVVHWSKLEWNIGATALVTEAATANLGEAGVRAATGVMTVAIPSSLKFTPKSIAVHNATEVARFVASCMAFAGAVSCGKSRNISVNGNAKTARSERKKDMIENVLEIKDTHVREVMTPLVDVVAIDASATLVDFHNSWVDHQYSGVPVFEERIDNIVGIAYAMDLLDYVQKGNF